MNRYLRELRVPLNVNMKYERAHHSLLRGPSPSSLSVPFHLMYLIYSTIQQRAALVRPREIDGCKQYPRVVF